MPAAWPFQVLGGNFKEDDHVLHELAQFFPLASHSPLSSMSQLLPVLPPDRLLHPGRTVTNQHPFSWPIQ